MTVTDDEITREAPKSGALAQALAGAPRALRPRREDASAIPEGRPSENSRRRDSRYRRALGCADVVAAGVALVVGVNLQAGLNLTLVAAAVVPLIVLVGKVTGLYDRDEHILHKTTLDEAPGVFQVSLLYTFIVWLGEGLVVNGDIDRTEVVVTGVLLGTLMLATRAGARRLARAWSPPERCLVLGNAASAARLVHKFDVAFAVKASLIGRVGVDRPERRFGRTEQAGRPGAETVPMLGTMETLGLVLEAHEVDRVIIDPSAVRHDDVLEAVRIIRALGVKASVVPGLFEVVGSSVEQDDVHGLSLLGLRGYGLSTSSRALKRALDLSCAVAVLIVLAPLMLWIAAAIKLTSPGPVFFRQRRVGRNGRAFHVLKFRTMYEDAEARKAALVKLSDAADGFFKITEDPRVTRVGGVLRRLSLDELPQLLNVLRGEMSLVGPRPLIGAEDSQIEGWRRMRSSLVPGMTGPWQVLGSSIVPMHEMVKLDYLYGANWSLWLDIKILLRTVQHVFARRGR